MIKSIALDIKTAPSDPGQTYPHLDFSTIDDTTCFLILKYLQPQDLLVISLVNRRWLSWANNDKLWRDAFDPGYLALGKRYSFRTQRVVRDKYSTLPRIQAATYKLTRTVSSNTTGRSLSRSLSGVSNPVLLIYCSMCGASTLVGDDNGYGCDGCYQNLRSLYNNVKVSPPSPLSFVSFCSIYVYIHT